MHIEFEFRDQNELCILRLQGRFLTGADADYLRAKAEELKRTGCRKAVADFREVPYLDSTGIGFMVGLYTSMKNAGGSFAMAGVSQRVREVLSITRLVEIIPIFDTEQEAIAAVNAPAKVIRAEGA